MQELESLTADEVQRFWELYVSWSDNHNLKADLSGFEPWLEERY